MLKNTPVPKESVLYKVGNCRRKKLRGLGVFEIECRGSKASWRGYSDSL